MRRENRKTQLKTANRKSMRQPNRQNNVGKQKKSSEHERFHQFYLMRIAQNIDNPFQLHKPFSFNAGKTPDKEPTHAAQAFRIAASGRTRSGTMTTESPASNAALTP